MSNHNYSSADSDNAADDLRRDAVDRMTTPAMAAVARNVKQLRAQAGPAMHELAQNAQHLAHDSAEAVRQRATRLGESSAGYVRVHPLQSVLLAAGAGAVLAVVLSLMARPR